MPKSLNSITLILVIVGALNWLLVGLFEFDLVAAITGNDFGETNIISRIIYILVGLSGLVQLGNLGQILSRDDDRVAR
jgi:uncharacterized membrane protein YuzA (DUF378 family)